MNEAMSAARGAGIPWSFAEQRAADATATLLRESGFGIIKIVFVPFG